MPALRTVLAPVRIVLVGTSHPGNIGAAARAMKAMGLSRLELVAPERFPCAEATARAAGADDLLAAARVHAGLESAVGDCALVVATSARARRLGWDELSPEAAARELLAVAARAPVALVFGRERTGLANAELERCHASVTIATEPDFRSLNLAAAVQLLGYELRRAAAGGGRMARGEAPERASADAIEGLYRHLEEALVEIGYLDPGAPKLLMRRLRRLLGRARLERAEVNILRGILSAAQRAARRGPGGSATA